METPPRAAYRDRVPEEYSVERSPRSQVVFSAASENKGLSGEYCKKESVRDLAGEIATLKDNVRLEPFEHFDLCACST